MQKPPEIIIHNCIIHEQHLYHVMECIIGTITSITLSKEKSKHIFRKFVRFFLDKTNKRSYNNKYRTGVHNKCSILIKIQEHKRRDRYEK